MGKTQQACFLGFEQQRHLCKTLVVRRNEKRKGQDLLRRAQLAVARFTSQS